MRKTPRVFAHRLASNDIHKCSRRLSLAAAKLGQNIIVDFLLLVCECGLPHAVNAVE